MEDKEFSLTLCDLSLFFGDNYVWGSRTHEVVGYDKESNRFVIIEDGTCRGRDWMYQIWDFNGAEMSAEDWFFKKFKWCCDDVGATLVCEELFNGFENLIFVHLEHGYENITQSEIDELQSKGEKCFIIKHFEFEGCDCVQYDEDDFFATVQTKDGRYKGVEAKSLDELQHAIKISGINLNLK
jgi:hypothetical protein